ncbi:TetR family transcriptional regulator [Marinobacteraceae bacterium S3BR75-40.1]
MDAKVSTRSQGSGKQRLVEAAIRLAADSRSIHAIGLRSLAREAGLNPNTFYRHFDSIDDLALTIIQSTVTELREPLSALRRQAADAAEDKQTRRRPAIGIPFDIVRGQRVTRETVRLFFDYVERNPSPFLVGARELHGPSPVVRDALRRVMADFTADMVRDMKELELLPNLDDPALERVSATTIRMMFHLSVDFIEQPDRRQTIVAEAEDMILTLLAGAVTLSYLPR